MKKLPKKEFVSVNILLIITSMLIVSVFAVPTLTNIYENFKMDKYESLKSDIINGAKSKFSASVSDIGDNKVVEYTIKDLIKEGYLKGTEINPLTNKKYNDNDKVLVISKNGNISYKYITTTTLTKEIKNSNSVLTNDKEYYYKGSVSSNYLSFNEEIYRIIKLDKDDNIYIIPEKNKKIKKEDIDSYLNSYKNDNFNIVKDNIIDVTLIDLKTYNSTKNDNGSTFLKLNDNFWTIDDKEYKVYDPINNNYIDKELSTINPVIILDNTFVVQKGNGSRLNPYVIN